MKILSINKVDKKKYIKLMEIILSIQVATWLQQELKKKLGLHYLVRHFKLNKIMKIIKKIQNFK